MISIRLPVIFVFAFIITACGFQLRGSNPIPPALQNIVINSQSGYIAFDQALNSALRRAGINVMDKGTPATGSVLELKVNPLLSQETILGTASNNDVLQLERQLITNYFIRQADGKSVYGPRRISTSKLFTEQDASVNTKEASDADALNEMAEDLAEKLLLDMSYAPL
jgi:LPS-assembly lipoprotein